MRVYDVFHDRCVWADFVDLIWVMVYIWEEISNVYLLMAFCIKLPTTKSRFEMCIYYNKVLKYAFICDKDLRNVYLLMTKSFEFCSSKEFWNVYLLQQRVLTCVFNYDKVLKCVITCHKV